MKQLKKKLQLLAVAVSLVVVGASPASAQVAFQMSSLVRTVRLAGTTEAVGQVTLTSTTTGDIAADSTLSLDYGTDIVTAPAAVDPVAISGGVTGSTNEVTGATVVAGGAGYVVSDVLTVAGGTGTSATLTVTALTGEVATVSVLTGGSYTVDPTNPVSVTGGTGAGATFNLTLAALGAVLSFAIDNEVLTITFDTGATFAVGGSIIISSIRVDANDFGLGTISAAGSATVPAAAAATNPITFFIVNQVPVAEVQSAFDVDIALGGSLLTCVTSDTTFSIDITEEFNQAFASAADEVGFGDAGAIGADGTEVNMSVVVTFEDLPNEDVSITFLGTANADNPSTIALPLAATVNGDPTTADLPENSADGGGDIVFTFEITATATTGAAEALALVFEASADAGDLPPGSQLINGVVTIEGGGTGEVARFTADIQGEGTVFTLADCVSNLILPWVVAGSVGFDTGVAISNTTRDDSPFSVDEGFDEQTGSCMLTGYTSTDGTQVGPWTTAPIGPGATLAFNFSTASSGMFSGFIGQVLVECGFQGAHAFAFITDGFPGTPALAQGYLGIVIPTVSGGRDVGGTGELGGK